MHEEKSAVNLIRKSHIESSSIRSLWVKNGRPGLDLIFVGSPGKVSLEEDSSESIEAESHKWQCFYLLDWCQCIDYQILLKRILKTFVVNLVVQNSVTDWRLEGKNFDNVLKNVVIGKIPAITSGGCESGHQELWVETVGFLPFQKRWNKSWASLSFP